MNNKMIKKVLLPVALIILSACTSDGQHSAGKMAPVAPSLDAPKVNAFTVSSLSEPTKSGKSITVKSGDSIVLAWDVAGANTVEIAGSDGKFASGPQKLKGTIQIDGVSSDVAYALTAKSEGTAQDRVEVKVSKPEPVKITDAYASPQRIKAGESSEICWSVSNKDAKVTVSDGETTVYPPDVMDDVAEDKPAEDKPADQTTATATQTKLLLSKADTVTEPTVTTTPPVATPAEVAASDDKADDKTDESSEVCISVMPAKTTIYTIVASVEGSNDQKEVTVTVGEEAKKGDDTTTGGGVTPVPVPTPVPSARLSVAVSNNDIYAGEEVSLTVKAEGVASKDGATLTDPRQLSMPLDLSKADYVKIKPVVSGEYRVKLGDMSSAVHINVRSLGMRDSSAWAVVTASGMNRITAAGGGSNGSFRFAKAAAEDAISTSAYDFAAAFGAKMGKDFDVNWLKSNVKPFSVNALAFGSGSRVYAGVTGGILYSDNAGGAWADVDVIPVYDSQYQYKDKEESHPGCMGTTRKGTKSYGKNWLVNVVDVCDVAVITNAEGKERLLIATDFGPFFIDDVDGRINDCDKEKTKENTCKNAKYALKGATKANVLFKKVVNRLALVKSGDSKIVVAATSDGVYMNNQMGDAAAWEKVGDGLEGEVYSLAASGASLFAGTANGVYRNETWPAAGNKWTRVLESGKDSEGKAAPIMAIAVDASDKSTILIGDALGVAVSRTCGDSWASVKSNVGEVRSIASASNGAESAVVVAGKKGLFSVTGPAIVSGECSTFAAPKKEDVKKPDETIKK